MHTSFFNADVGKRHNDFSISLGDGQHERIKSVLKNSKAKIYCIVKNYKPLACGPQPSFFNIMCIT